MFMPLNNPKKVKKPKTILKIAQNHIYFLMQFEGEWTP